MPSDACGLSLSRPTGDLKTKTFHGTPVRVQPSFRARLEESQGILRYLRDISLPLKIPVSSSRPLLARNLPQSKTENQRSFKISLTGHGGLDAVIVLIQVNRLPAAQPGQPEAVSEGQTGTLGLIAHKQPPAANPRTP